MIDELINLIKGRGKDLKTRKKRGTQGDHHLVHYENGRKVVGKFETEKEAKEHQKMLKETGEERTHFIEDVKQSVKDKIKKAMNIKHKYQKDWIIMDRDKGNLFCLAITSDDNKYWFLLEYVQFFNLPKEKMSKMIDMGYKTMLEASHETDYKYIIAEHQFSKADFEKNSEYWKRMTDNPKALGKLSFKHGEKAIDIEELETETKKLKYKTGFEADLNKAMSLSPMSDINVDISDHAVVEAAAKENPYYSIIQEAMAEFELGEVSREIQLTNTHKLTCRQEDNGIYSGEVRCIALDSGEFGQVVHKIIKKTLADLVQELKLKEFITAEDLRNPPSEIHSEPDLNPDIYLEVAEKIEAVVEGHEEEAEGLSEESPKERQMDVEMVDSIKEIIEESSKINEVRHSQPDVDNILSTILSIAEVDTRPININIHLAKAKKAAVGEIHVYSGKRVQKQSDGTWKLLSEKKQNKKPKGSFAEARHQDKGYPHTVDMTIEINGKQIQKTYSNVHGHSRYDVRADLVDQLASSLGKKGVAYRIKKLTIKKNKINKAVIEEVIDLIKGGVGSGRRVSIISHTSVIENPNRKPLKGALTDLKNSLKIWKDRSKKDPKDQRAANMTSLLERKIRNFV